MTRTHARPAPPVKAAQPALPVQQLHVAFEAVAEAYPDATALSAPGWSLTYRDVNQRANRLARHLRARRVGAGAVVGLLLPRGADAVVSMLAVLKLGGVYVPLDPAHPASRLSYLLGDAGVSLVITLSELAPVLGTTEVPQVRLDQVAAQLKRRPSRNVTAAGQPSALACLLYTSGSTGQPKGVQVPQQGVLNLVFGQDYCDFGPHQVHLMLSSLGFDFSALELWGALLHGARLAIYEERFVSLPGLARLIREQGVTTLMITPSLLGHLVSERLPELTTLRQVLVGGDVAPVATVRALLAGVPGCALINVYGPTENTVLTTTFTVRGGDEVPSPLPIGRAVRGACALVLSEDRTPVAEGEVGELWVGGAGLSPAYVNRGELSAERFVQLSPDPAGRLYRTGDLARVLPGGELDFLGRRDFQVKVRGHRVELPEIERALCELPQVREAAVLALALGPDPEKRLVAFYTPVSGAALPADQVKAFLRARLPDYMVPSVLMEVEAFPLTTNGKADRQALAALAVAGNGAVPLESRQPGASGQELPALWAELLGRTPGPDDDFFLLGGTSLLAALLLSRVADRYGAELPTAVFFARPTVKAMSQWLSGHKGDQQDGHAPHQGSRPLLLRPAPEGPDPPAPLILIGDPYQYRRMVPHLGTPGAVYSLACPLNTVESMAQTLVAALRASPLRAPYRLCGFSFDGLVTYEMARHLLAAGEPVEFLGLIDSSTPQVERLTDARLSPAKLTVYLGALRRLPDADRRAFLVRRLGESARRLLGRGGAVNLDFKVRHALMEQYRPGPYPGGLTLYRATAQVHDLFDPLLGWGALAGGEVQVVPVRGTHMDLIRSDTAARRLGSVLGSGGAGSRPART